MCLMYRMRSTYSIDQLIQSSNQLTQSSNQLIQSSNQLIQSSNQLIQSSNQLIQSSNQLIKSSNQLIQSSNQLIQPSNQLINVGNPNSKIRELPSMGYLIWSTWCSVNQQSKSSNMKIMLLAENFPQVAARATKPSESLHLWSGPGAVCPPALTHGSEEVAVLRVGGGEGAPAPGLPAPGGLQAGGHLHLCVAPDIRMGGHEVAVFPGAR